MLLALVVGCATPEVVEVEKIVTQVVKETVVETVIVEGTPQVVEKEITRVVEVTPAPPLPASKKGGTFAMALGGDPSGLNGLYASSGYDLWPVTLSQRPLIVGGMDWGSVVEGDLAESWEASDDGTVWTFHLRQDVKWQDGEPFTADDVLFTIAAAQDPELQAAYYRERFLEDGEPILFEKLDDYTVRATLSSPRASFHTSSIVPILPQHILEGQDIRTSAYNEKPIGTGPFVVESWRSGESITLVANPFFYRGEPYLDRFVFRVIPSEEARLMALQTGEIDFLEILGKDVPRFLNNPQFTVITSPKDQQRHILLNNAQPYFQDQRVRQALMYALDRQAIVNTALQGYGYVADSPFNRTTDIYQEGKLTQYEFNLEKAKELLTEAGWVDSDGDGIIDKDGVAFKINLDYLTSWGFIVTSVPLVQNWWGQLGIDVTARAVEAASYLAAIRVEDIEKPYDCFFLGLSQMGPDPDSFTNPYANSAPELNIPNYYNEEVKKLFDQARITVDPDERHALYEQAELILWNDLPALPLFYPINVYAINNRVNMEEAVFDTSFVPPFRYPDKLFIQQ
jgi:peptide/nickel transport system substrate-binding protein